MLLATTMMTMLFVRLPRIRVIMLRVLAPSLDRLQTPFPAAIIKNINRPVVMLFDEAQ